MNGARPKEADVAERAEQLEARVREMEVQLAAYRRLLERHTLASRGMDANPDPVLWVRRDGSIHNANDAIGHLYGISKSLLRGMHVGKLIPSVNGHQWDEHLKLVSHFGTLTVESDFIDRNGANTAMEWSTVLVSNADETLAMIVARDIRHRKHIEMELQQHREQLKRTQEIAEIGSWALSPESGMVTLSDNALNLFGLVDESSQLGWPAFLKLIHEDDRQGIQEKVMGAVENGGSFDIEYRILGPNGEVRYLEGRGEVDVEPITGQRRAYCAVQDVTERVNAQRELESMRAIEQDAQQLRLANKFAATVAHEFNTPLNVILSAAQLLQMHSAVEDDWRETLEKVPRQVERMRHLVHRLLALDSLEEKPYVGNTTILDLSRKRKEAAAGSASPETK